METLAPKHVVSEETSFRDRLTTVTEDGKRKWVYAKKPNGKFTNYRLWVAYACIGTLFLLPFLKINGYPLLLINILERKFVVFGNVFWPQDFYILALSVLAFFVFIILFTAIFGRIWCGWTCPQTVFMESVFRRVEYLIEGDRNQQIKLDQMPWNGEKILKKGSKYLVFASFSFAIGNLVMCYLVGYEQVFAAMLEGVRNHKAAFGGVMAFSALFMFVFTIFREQACTIVCPYGRLQGVLLSNTSLVVAYDFIRGENRGKLGHATGDCVDCGLCVHVCPTGIDIRNGTQLECINCTACVDACNDVMLKINKPKGLIRFDSINGILHGVHWKMTGRIYGYAILLSALIGLIVYFLANRKNIETTLLRVSGQTFQVTAQKTVTNLYNLQVANKTLAPVKLQMQLEGLPNAQINVIGKSEMMVPAEKLGEFIFQIEVPLNQLHERKTNLKIHFKENNKEIGYKKIAFLGPF